MAEEQAPVTDIRKRFDSMKKPSATDLKTPSPGAKSAISITSDSGAKPIGDLRSRFESLNKRPSGDVAASSLNTTSPRKSLDNAPPKVEIPKSDSQKSGLDDIRKRFDSVAKDSPAGAAQASRKTEPASPARSSGNDEATRKAELERLKKQQLEDEIRRRVEAEWAEKQRQEEEERSKPQRLSGSGPVLPKLEKIDITKYASERERLYAETDVKEASKRLSSIQFDFKFQ